MSRILLTGAAGFVGRNLLAEGADSGHVWTALDLGFPASGLPGPSTTETVISDMSDVGALRETMARVRPEVVVHLAGWTGKGGSAENRGMLLSANLATTWNLLDAIALSGIGAEKPVQFVLASSALVYGDQPGPFNESMAARPADEYAVTKWVAEETVRAYARRGIVAPSILRPAVIYGPGQKGAMFVPSLVRALVEGRHFPMTGGEQKRDLVHVRDVARAVLAIAAERAEGVFNVGSGVGIPMLEIGRILATSAGRPDLLGIGEIAYRGNESWEYAVDASKLAKATGWNAKTPLEDGLKEVLDKERMS